MPQFKDREEYKKWKAERQRELARKTQGEIPASAPEEPQQQQVPQPGPALSGLSPIGELFSSSWGAYKSRFSTLIPLYLLVILLFVLPLMLFLGGGFALSTAFPDAKGILMGIGGLLGTLISFVTIFWGTAGLVYAVTDEALGIRDALSRGWLRKWSFLWLFSVLGFVITGGFLLFFIPGLLFLVWFSFAQFSLAEEDERGMRALLKSKEFVRGYGLDVFFRLFLVWLISGVLGIIPFVGPILSFLFLPFVMIYSCLIYRELKTLKGDVSIVATAGEKMKWLGTAALGYVLVPILAIAIFGASLLSSIVLLKGMMSSPGTALFSQNGQPAEKGAPRLSEVVRPSNFNELLGTWTGSETGRSAGWTFTFSEGYAVHVVSPSGEWYRGKASIHFDLGVTDGNIRVPPGAGILDIDVDEASAGNYAGKTSLGAFSISDSTSMKLCGGEPGKTKRPESFEPEGGIRCFELTRISGAPQPPVAQPQAPASRSPMTSPSKWPDASVFIYSANYKGVVKVNGKVLENIPGERDMQYNFNKGGWDLQHGKNIFELEYEALPDPGWLLELKIRVSGKDSSGKEVVLHEWSTKEQKGTKTIEVFIN